MLEVVLSLCIGALLGGYAVGIAHHWWCDRPRRWTFPEDR